MQLVQASESIRQGQQIYRYKQEVESAGFGIELDISTQAIVVGPDSDFNEYSVIYFDPTRGLRATLGTITPDRPWIGRLDSRVDLQPGKLTTKTVGGLDIPYNTGRIIVIPENSFDIRDFEPFGSQNFVVQKPVADVIGYTSSANFVAEKRANPKVITPVFVEPGTEVRYFFPFYGRRCFTFVTTDSNLEASLLGVNFLTSNTSPFFSTEFPIGVNFDASQVRYHYETNITGRNGQPNSLDSYGGYDYLIVRFSAPAGSNDPADFDDGGYNFLLSTSDEPGGV